MVAKNANPKRWLIRPSIDGKNYSVYQLGNKTPSSLLTLPYTSAFPLVENPVSEAGIWLNGGVTGLLWNNMQTNGSSIYGTSASPDAFDDNIACINPAVFTFGARQYLKVVIDREGGYSPAQVHEVEMHLNCTITGNRITTMENLMDTGNNSTTNRWNGDLGDVSFLSPSGAGVGALADGDLIHFRVDENGLYEVFKNGSGTPSLSITDTALPIGVPGVAAFWRPDASIVPASLGFKSIEVGNW